MFTKFLEQYKIGETWLSKGRTITEADLVMFSAFSGDWFPLHTDKEYASRTLFKQRIAHGMLVLSAATGLFQFEPGVVVAFYGMEHVRFTNPTFIGDTIHSEVKIIDIQEKDNGRGIITALQEIKKQTGETVVVATIKLMVNKSPNH
ncbi:MaoC/PaaZ C-terminal domain-containing protein [Polycladomyces subterraneus]|uniref:MaoC/PaaZ C-terminal domain-containing protein n=1 Tax=Polycladomyces subterraneus TaxID=1016997 RepID=A0ABT8IKR3_9BACL|nr:MaoC/PaaZ C-terminal domain-containing protein [Polycladomyces subterraneus]MDN4593305.1 MaoC/PaaZ C-terminal domain-containing protein [Polycladomyces subterraneus]